MENGFIPVECVPELVEFSWWNIPSFGKIVIVEVVASVVLAELAPFLGACFDIDVCSLDYFSAFSGGIPHWVMECAVLPQNFFVVAFDLCFDFVPNFFELD